MRMNQCHERVGPAFVFHKSGIDIQMQRCGVSIAGLRNSHRVGLQRGGKGIKASRKTRIRFGGMGNGIPRKPAVGCGLQVLSIGIHVPMGKHAGDNHQMILWRRCLLADFHIVIPDFQRPCFSR